MPRPTTYFETLTAAINEMATHGFDSAERVKYWQDRLREAADASIASEAEMDQQLRDALAAVYHRLVNTDHLFKLFPGVSRFTLERIRPQLRAELDRRIMASAQLIKLNRAEAIDKTLRRFAGWSTSIPKGGSDTVDRRKQKTEIRKSLAQLPFEARRVHIDQGHKLVSSINNIVAQDGGALAVRWNSHWRERNYNYREDHKERDGKVYLLKKSWARDNGLVKPGEAGLYEDITAFAEEPFCRCYGTYLTALRDLPDNMMTAKGRETLAAARAKIREMA